MNTYSCGLVDKKCQLYLMISWLVYCSQYRKMQYCIIILLLTPEVITSVQVIHNIFSANYLKKTCFTYYPLDHIQCSFFVIHSDSGLPRILHPLDTGSSFLIISVRSQYVLCYLFQSPKCFKNTGELKSWLGVFNQKRTCIPLPGKYTQIVVVLLYHNIYSDSTNANTKQLILLKARSAQ